MHVETITADRKGEVLFASYVNALTFWALLA